MEVLCSSAPGAFSILFSRIIIFFLTCHGECYIA